MLSHFFCHSELGHGTGVLCWLPICRLLRFLPVFHLICRTFGSPREGISIGPIKFSQRAELLNARMAMVGYVILAYVGYNQVGHFQWCWLAISTFSFRYVY